MQMKDDFINADSESLVQKAEWRAVRRFRSAQHPDLTGFGKK